MAHDLFDYNKVLTWSQCGNLKIVCSKDLSGELNYKGRKQLKLYFKIKVKNIKAEKLPFLYLGTNQLKINVKNHKENHVGCKNKWLPLGANLKLNCILTFNSSYGQGILYH